MKLFWASTMTFGKTTQTATDEASHYRAQAELPTATASFARRIARFFDHLAYARVPWVLAASALLAGLSLVYLSTPTYDPWAWLIWGREVAHLDLSTQFGPSWKPFPVVFTTLFSPLGAAAPALWLVVARTGGLLALAMAYRLATRLAGPLAGLVAAASLLISAGWFSQVTGGLSEEIMVALFLWACERHLAGRPRHALVLGFCAGLLRPEVWPFLLVYVVYIGWRSPRDRSLGVALLVALPVLWIMPEWWGSGDPFRASSRAIAAASGETVTGMRAISEVVSRAWGQLILPVKVLAGAAVVFALLRRERFQLVLAGSAIAWVGVVTVMAVSGYPGIARFTIPAAGAVCVLSGVGAVRLLGLFGQRGSVAIAAAVFVAALALAVPRLSQAPHHLRVEEQADRNRDLHPAVAAAGPPSALRFCGRPYTSPESVPALAWQLDLHVGAVGFDPAAPGAVFRSLETSLPQTPQPPFHPVARAGQWEVLAACQSPGALPTRTGFGGG